MVWAWMLWQSDALEMNVIAVCEGAPRTVHMSKMSHVLRYFGFRGSWKNCTFTGLWEEQPIRSLGQSTRLKCLTFYGILDCMALGKLHVYRSMGGTAKPLQGGRRRLPPHFPQSEILIFAGSEHLAGIQKAEAANALNHNTLAVFAAANA